MQTSTSTKMCLNWNTFFSYMNRVKCNFRQRPFTSGIKLFYNDAFPSNFFRIYIFCNFSLLAKSCLTILKSQKTFDHQKNVLHLIKSDILLKEAPWKI